MLKFDFFSPFRIESAYVAANCLGCPDIHADRDRFDLIFAEDECAIGPKTNTNESHGMLFIIPAEHADIDSSAGFSGRAYMVRLQYEIPPSPVAARNVEDLRQHKAQLDSFNQPERHLYVPCAWKPSNPEWYKSKLSDIICFTSCADTRLQASFLVQELIVRLHTEFTDTLNGVGCHSDSERSIPPIVKEIAKYLSMQWMNKVTLEELSRFFGLHPIYLGRLFKQHTGTSPIHFHHAIRMENAKRLVRNTTLTVKQIASEIGIENPYYFSRHFKTFTGLSPSKYRMNFAGSSLMRP